MKDILTVLHGIFYSRPCVHCLSTFDDIRPLRGRELREVTETNPIRAWARDKDKEAGVQNVRRNRRAHQMLLEHGMQMPKSLSLSHWELFSDRCKIVPDNTSFYSFSRFEHLHSLHLRVSKLVKGCRLDMFPQTC